MGDHWTNVLDAFPVFYLVVPTLGSTMAARTEYTALWHKLQVCGGSEVTHTQGVVGSRGGDGGSLHQCIGRIPRVLLGGSDAWFDDGSPHRVHGAVAYAEVVRGLL